MKSIPLFFATFASAFLLFFGIAVGVLMVFPVVANTLTPAPEYHPPLPLSEDREEEFFDIAKNQGRQLFPPLTGDQILPATGGNRIVIPSIGIDVPIALSPTLNDADILATLDQGAALYPNGIEPGRLGNTFISAHSTGEPWKGAYRFAFLRINELEPGNLLHLDYNGTRYTYRMTEQEIVVPSPDFRVESGRPVPTMSLMACWPLWSTQKRMIIHSELVNVTKLTPTPA